jgi:pyruvate formate lyase activating enzyme
MLHGLIFNIQRFSIHDGPGIRTTVFLKGCPATCWWCHNPESQSVHPEIMVREGRCLRCGACAEVCPDGLHRAAVCCLHCGRCAEACPTGARLLAGTRMGVDEVLAEALRDSVFYRESGGGVTFSGGEPLLQFPFLEELLRACREAGVHTAVDTCGFAPWDRLLAVAAQTDLFLFDLKSMNPERHYSATGVPNGPILENLKALAAVHGDIRIRIPVIPGFNDDPESLEALARMAASLPELPPVSLLPYNQLGFEKSARLGRPSRRAVPPPPSRARMEEAAAVFRRAGLETRVGR